MSDHNAMNPADEPEAETTAPATAAEEAVDAPASLEATGAVDDPTFEELARSVSLNEQGRPVLDFAEVPDTLFGRLTRLGLVFLVGFGILLFVGYAGYWYYTRVHPFESKYHDADRNYMAVQRSEAQQLQGPPDRKSVV